MATVSSASFDENRSVWVGVLPDHVARPPLRGSIHADVAVIGGGLTGVSVAWHLSRRFTDRRIVLLEARTLANGASGRNGGQVLNWINGVSIEDAETARRVHSITSAGIDLIESMAQESELPAGFSRNGCLEVFTTERAAEQGHAHAEQLARAGVAAEWLSSREVGIRGATGAIRDPVAGSVNAAALVRGLRPVLERRGVSFYEQTPVLSVQEGEQIRLTTPEGDVRAGAVVLATNAYTPMLGYFRDGILPLHSHVVALGPLPESTWAETGLASSDGFSDDRARVAYGCRTASGHLVFGGGSNAAYSYLYGGSPVYPSSSEAEARALAAVRSCLGGYFPELARVEPQYSWSGAVALTFDRICSMGVCGENQNVYYALGYSGHGLALAALSGRVLSDLYAGDHDPWRSAPFYQRALPRIPPEPLRWIGYQVYTRLTGRSPRRA